MIGTPWKHRIELKDLLTEDEDPATVRRVAGEVYQRLEAFRLAYYPDDMRMADVVEDFESLSDDDDADVIWFNNLMSDLYDWGDREKRLWIA